MAKLIKYVAQGSPANKAGIEPEDSLISINGHDISDVLDYRFHSAARNVELVIEKNGVKRTLKLKKDEYEDLGLEFETYLMDDAIACKNKCIFCFIDQNPKGMRETIYFKDDDTRLSFLTGNYVTMTNISQKDIDRIIEQRIMPINISVHTTDPKLRSMMLNNRFAGNIMDIMKRLADNKITMNAQIVLCPDINDGEALTKTLNDLSALYPSLNSISVVPVGLTKHRQGLYPLRPFTIDDARDALRRVNETAKICLGKYSSRVVYAADEIYITAKADIPLAAEYEDFPQLENGVGLISLMRDEFYEYIDDYDNPENPVALSIATGVAAYPYILSMVDDLLKRCDNLKIKVYCIENEFFGPLVTVAGLICGQDIENQLKNKSLFSKLIIPSCMLRADSDVFLDNMTINELSTSLGVPIAVALPGAQALLEEIFEQPE